MRENTITQLPDPSGFSSDPFTDVLRDGARKLIEQAIHAEQRWFQKSEQPGQVDFLRMSRARN